MKKHAGGMARAKIKSHDVKANATNRPDNGGSRAGRDASGSGGGEEDDNDGQVLVHQFTRDLQAVVRQVKERKYADKGVTANGDVCLAELPVVACYGALGQRLLTLVHKLMRATEELAVYKKEQLLITFGDKFMALHEYKAARVFFYQTLVDSRQDSHLPLDNPSASEMYVRAIFGAAMCRLHLARSNDEFVRMPGTLEIIVAVLKELQQGMEMALMMERTHPHRFAWLILNGTVLVYSIARPLQTLGFEREGLPYLKWCILALEANVTLSTTKYVLWRTQIYVSICESYEALARKRPKYATKHFVSAVACAQHAQSAVTRLRKEEELDLPVPKATNVTLRHAEVTLTLLAARIKQLSSGQDISRESLSALVSDDRARIRFAVDALEKECQLSGQPERARTLLEGIIDLVRPIVTPLADAESITPENIATVNAQLPLTFHMSLIRQSYLLKHHTDATTLITTARTRCARCDEPLFFQAEVNLELNLYETLVEWDKCDIGSLPQEEVISLPLIGKTLPYEKTRKVASALSAFIYHSAEPTNRAVRNLLASVALRLWKECGRLLVNELDAAESTQRTDKLLNSTITILQVIHLTLGNVDVDDPILFTTIGIRLCIFLKMERRLRKAIQVARLCLQKLDYFRDVLATRSNHFCSILADKNSRELSRATFSFETHSEDAPIASFGEANARDSLGVAGSGSQFGSLNQELCSLQVDVLLLTFELELQEGETVNSIEIEHDPPVIESPPPATSIVKTALQKQFKKNGCARALLNIQIVLHTDQDTKAIDEQLEECLKFLRQAEAQEQELLRASRKCDAVVTESLVPQSPQIISRCSTSVELKIIEYRPPSMIGRRQAISYYMVFAKPSGAGTAVSLNNNTFPGTGELISPSKMYVTVSGLSPNNSYVFAVAAFDKDGDIIQAIGETSRPVVTLNPLPVVMCYGYLAQACFHLQLPMQTRRAATEVYNRIVSKAGAHRPSWASNPLYRHAVRRDVIARWPLSLLSVVAQSILIICDEEPGDSDRDGQYISDNDVLSASQITVLELSRKLMVGMEVASAAGDVESIRLLAFKGYRVLLPLLHLDDCAGIIFPSLMTHYQGLCCIPTDLWDIDTKNIAARIGFELARIAIKNRFLASTIYAELSKVRVSDASAAHALTKGDSREMTTLRERIALSELFVGRPHANATPVEIPKPSSSEPSVVTRTIGDTTPQTQPTERDTIITRIVSIIAQANYELGDTVKLFSAEMKSSMHWIEGICQLLRCALERGEDAVIEDCIPLIKIQGRIGTKLRSVLSSVGMEHLLSDLSNPPPEPVASAPSTARSVKSPRNEPSKPSEEATEKPSTLHETEAGSDVEHEVGDDDDYMYTWCGELCFLQAIVLYRKIANAQSGECMKVDTTKGPNYDFAFDILNERQESIPTYNQLETTFVVEVNSAEATDEKSAISELFVQFLSKIASCCELFYLGRAWQALQTSSQYLCNGISLAWVPPTVFSEAGSSLDKLVSCVDALLDMLETVSASRKGERVGLATPIPGSSNASSLEASVPQCQSYELASTIVVTSAMSSIVADQTWIAGLVSYAIQALMSARRWDKMVQMGKRYHFFSGGKRFSEKIFPMLIYAQRQFLAEENARLANALSDFDSFVKAFTDSEAKKKKKKSRLVVEEVLTPEELAFRAKRDTLEVEIQELTLERDARHTELRALQKIHDGLSRGINKTVLAFDTCHDLMEIYRRGEKNDTAVRSQIIGGLTQCVTLSRQKRQKFLTCQALDELGDFLWEIGDQAAGVKKWSESIDAACNALHATKSWREVLRVAESPDDEYLREVESQIEGDGLWIGLTSCNVLFKLILYASGSDCFQTVDYALMASTIFSRLCQCSLPHPTRDFLYGTYEIPAQFWPGRDFFTDQERISPVVTGSMFMVIPQVLLQYDYAVDALPLIAGYEYVTAQCFEDINHVANARRLRVEALIQCGRYREAFVVLAQIFNGVTVPSLVEKPMLNALLPVVQFRDDKLIHDDLNLTTLTWLSTLDVAKLEHDLLVYYRPTVVQLILVTTLKAGVYLSRYEPTHLDLVLRRAMQLFGDAITQLLEISITTVDLGSADPDRWGALQRANLLAEVLLLRSELAFADGQWAQCREFCTTAIDLAKPHHKSESENDTNDTIVQSFILTLDHYVPVRLVCRASTIIAKCRMQNALCDIVQREYHHAVSRLDTGIQEARETGELHFIQRFQLLRAHAQIFLGSLQSALQSLTSLHDSFVENHTMLSGVYFIRAIQTTSFLLRAEAMEKHDQTKLLQALTLLETGEQVLDTILRRDGWVGVDVDACTDPRLNLYHPAMPVYILLKADLVQSLIETPTQSMGDITRRRQRSLVCIECGLKALHHTPEPSAPVKAKLLLMKGAVLKNALEIATSTVKEGDAQHEHDRLFNECVAALKAAVDESLQNGGCDRDLVCLALTELVDIYGQKRIAGAENEHIQAAFHYLQLALLVRSHQRILFDTLELQRGTLTAVEALPAFVVDAITQHGAEGGGGSGSPIATDNDTNAHLPLDTTRVVNYFVALLRDRVVLPVCTQHTQNLAILLHKYLLLNHSSYAKSCCLKGLPLVPADDPEISGGMVCVHWGCNITPGLNAISERPTSRSINLFFTLGTTRIEPLWPTEVSNEEHADAWNERMDRFASFPLLSKRVGLYEHDLNVIRHSLSLLRIDMDDEQSLVVDRGTFSSTLFHILLKIQQLFRAPPTAQYEPITTQNDQVIQDNQLQTTDESPALNVLDRFGSIIPVECSLKTVACLESLFHTQRGVNTCDNALCYFLRDLLDTSNAADDQTKS